MFRDPVSFGLTLLRALAWQFLFVYARARHLSYTGQVRLYPTEFSLAFQLLNAGVLFATASAGRLAKVWGLATLIGRQGVTGFAFVFAVLTGVSAGRVRDSLPVLLSVCLLGHIRFSGRLVPSANSRGTGSHTA